MFVKNALQTVATTKRALTPRDVKRYHVSKEKSYGYGHPAIAKVHDETQVENNPKTAEKRKCEDVTNDDQRLGCNLAYKRAKNGHELYKN